MPRPPYSRHPLGPVLRLALAIVVALMIALFVLGAITYAYRRIGIGQGVLFALIWLSLLGGFVNIPVAKLRGRETLGIGEVVAFGVRYRIPIVRRQPATILAVNLGGAVIPTALSLYLLIRNDVWWQAAIAVVFVAALVHAIARPVPGLGIAVPALVPPLLAASAALIVSAAAAASIAYISGTLGTLIGADLLNLRRLRNLNVPAPPIDAPGRYRGARGLGFDQVRCAQHMPREPHLSFGPVVCRLSSRTSLATEQGLCRGKVVAGDTHGLQLERLPEATDLAQRGGKVAAGADRLGMLLAEDPLAVTDDACLQHERLPIATDLAQHGGEVVAGVDRVRVLLAEDQPLGGSAPRRPSAAGLGLPVPVPVEALGPEQRELRGEVLPQLERPLEQCLVLRRLAEPAHGDHLAVVEELGGLGEHADPDREGHSATISRSAGVRS